MILDYFDDEKVTVTLKAYTQAPDASGEWVDTLSTSTELTGVKYSAIRAAQYFNIQIDENIDEVFLTDGAFPDLRDKVKYVVEYGTEVYDVETAENIAELDEIMMIGMRYHK